MASPACLQTLLLEAAQTRNNPRLLSRATLLLGAHLSEESLELWIVADRVEVFVGPRTLAVVRVEFDRFLQMLQGQVDLRLFREQASFVEVSGRIFGIELDRLIEVLDRFLPPTEGRF